MQDHILGGNGALSAEHEALRRQTRALSREHERLRADGSQQADRLAHRARLRQNMVALEQHYARLRQQAGRRGRERSVPRTNASALDISKGRSRIK